MSHQICLQTNCLAKAIYLRQRKLKIIPKNMILHEKNPLDSAVIAQTTQVDAQTEYSICVTPFCSTMLQTPPYLFLVFMITKITMG